LFTHIDLARYGTKSGSPSLNRNDIHPALVALPTPKEQMQIATLLLEHDRETDISISNLDKAKHIKAALMQDLLTGKKRVTHLIKDSGESRL